MIKDAIRQLHKHIKAKLDGREVDTFVYLYISAICTKTGDQNDLFQLKVNISFPVPYYSMLLALFL